MLIRQIADGYALLTLPLTAEQKANLNLPLAVAIEWGIREAHLDDWVAELGYPLDLADSQDLAEELIAESVGQTQDPNLDFATRFVIAIRRYQMLLALCDSPSGRRALQTSQVQSLVTEQLDHARTYAAHIGSQNPDAAPVGVVCVLIVLSDTNAYEWISSQEIEFPNVLTD